MTSLSSAQDLEDGDGFFSIIKKRSLKKICHFILGKKKLRHFNYM